MISLKLRGGLSSGRWRRKWMHVAHLCFFHLLVSGGIATKRTNNPQGENGERVSECNHGRPGRPRATSFQSFEGPVYRVDMSNLVIRTDVVKVHWLQEVRCTCRPQACGKTEPASNKQVAFSSIVFEKLSQPRAVQDLTPYPSAAIFNWLVMC